MQRILIAFAITVQFALPAHAGHEAHTTAPTSASPAAARASLVDAEVRKIDREQGKITLKHGAIPSLEMPAMTMVFRVKEAALLDKLAPGDKIAFQAEKINGAYTVTRIEKAKAE